MPAFAPIRGSVSRWLRSAGARRSRSVGLAVAMDALSDNYDDTMNAESLKTWGRRWDELLEAAARARPAIPSGAILDLGIGTGTCASRFLGSPGARHVVGLDHSRRTLRLGQEALRRHLPDLRADCLVGAGEALPFADRSFDLVIASCSAHFMDLTRALPEVHRVLKPGGSFVLVEPGWSSILPAIFGYGCRRLLGQGARSERLKLFFMARRAARWMSPVRALVAASWLMTDGEWRDRLEAHGFTGVASARLARGRRPWRPDLLLVSASSAGAAAPEER